MRRTAILLAIMPLASCAHIGDLGSLGLDEFMPKVVFKNLKVQGITFQDIDSDFVFAIENPNPLKIKLSSFSYDIDLAGTDLINGTQNDGLTLEARGDSRLAFPVHVVFADLFKLVGDMKGKDTVPFQFGGHIGFNTPLGEVKIPYKTKGEFPVVHIPKFSFKAVRVGKLDLLSQSATLNVDLGVLHDGGSTLSLAGFDYALNFSGFKVAEGLIAELADAPAGQEKTISLPVKLNLLQIGGVIVDAITRKTRLDVKLNANLSVGTPFGVIPLSINEKGDVDVL